MRIVLFRRFFSSLSNGGLWGYALSVCIEAYSVLIEMGSIAVFERDNHSGVVVLVRIHESGKQVPAVHSFIHIGAANRTKAAEKNLRLVF